MDETKIREVLKQYGIKDEAIDEALRFLRGEAPPRPGKLRIYREGNNIVIELADEDGLVP